MRPGHWLGLLLFILFSALTLMADTHPFNGPFPGLPGWAGTRKLKPIWILSKQETVSGSGISWTICKSAPHSRQITMPAPHHSVFLQAGCPSCCPTNTVKALKAKLRLNFKQISSYFASTVFAVSEADLRGERLKSQVENNNHFTVHWC